MEQRPIHLEGPMNAMQVLLATSVLTRTSAVLDPAPPETLETEEDHPHKVKEGIGATAHPTNEVHLHRHLTDLVASLAAVRALDQARSLRVAFSLQLRVYPQILVLLQHLLDFVMLRQHWTFLLVQLHHQPLLRRPQGLSMERHQYLNTLLLWRIPRI
jgi:hypothetical protein